MGFWRSLKAMAELEFTAADPGEFIWQLQRRGMEMEQILPKDELTMGFSIRRKDLKKFGIFAEKRGISWKIIRKTGLYWQYTGLIKRPVLMFGLLIGVFLTFFLPCRLLFFNVEGNSVVSDRQIIAMAAENGLEFGALRQNVRSEKIKNALLKAIPELEWVGINTSGCVATISVRERQISQETLPQKGVSSIIAARDGIIQDVIVTAGSLSVQPGQAVKKGQVLISGYTDCGLSVRAERAKGEVYATTTYEFNLVLPAFLIMEETSEGQSEKFALIFGKNRINFYESSGILGGGCVKMYEENYVTLPGGFVLPLGIATHRSANTSRQGNDSPEEILKQAAERYLRSLMIAGSIISRDESITEDDGRWRLEGKYVCLEMIGTERIEEIITP